MIALLEITCPLDSSNIWSRKQTKQDYLQILSELDNTIELSVLGH